MVIGEAIQPSRYEGTETKLGQAGTGRQRAVQSLQVF